MILHQITVNNVTINANNAVYYHQIVLYVKEIEELE
jgi:hypothetical protein